MADLDSILSDARDDLETYIKDNRITDQHDSSLSDQIHEIADSATPIYNADLMECASDPRVFNRDDDGLIESGADLIRHVQVRVYLVIQDHLYEETESIIDNIFVECDDCGDKHPEDELHDVGDGDYVCTSCKESRDEDDEDDEDGTSGQDRESYADDQDRESYAVDHNPEG